MTLDFTFGAQRALACAAGWTSGSDLDDLAAPEVLVGLLAEPECRAALVLAAHGIDEAVVRSRWPALRQLAAPLADRARRFTPALAESLHAALARLHEYPQPVELATEHVLLGLVLTPGEAAGWLRERGLEPGRLEADVHRWAGHQPGPLEVEWRAEGGRRKAENDSRDEFFSVSPPSALRPPTSDFRLPPSLSRPLDAAANRAGEGLRVVEDYLRFVLDDAHLTGLAKKLRHRLAELLSALPAEERHAARETQQDVGTRISTPTEQSRLDAVAVAIASFQRTEQALRSLEEFSKPLDAELAAGFEQLRYAVYTLEKAADLTRASLARLADARLCVLVDGRASLDEFARLVESLVSAGVDLVQLRDKRLTDRALVERARKLRELTRGTSSLAIVNDRADIAAVSDADGVHVGQEELSVHQARRIVGPRALVGVSTHNLEQARQAVLDGASYLGVGPTFPSRTKAFAEFPGLAFVAAVAAEIRLPAFAIGGIDAGNVSQVVAAGLSRVAVGSAVIDDADPAAATRELRRLLEDNS